MDQPIDLTFCNAPVKRTEHLTEQHWTFVQESWVLFSDVQLLGGQTCWTFCWTRLNFTLTITHCERANWTNVQWLVKRTEQQSTSRKTKEMLSRSAFVQWKVWSRSNITEQDSTRVNKAQQGGQTLWTFCTQMFSVVQWNVQYVWLGPKMIEIIEQNFFNHEDSYLGPTFLFVTRYIFSPDDVTHIKFRNPM